MAFSPARITYKTACAPAPIMSEVYGMSPSDRRAVLTEIAIDHLRLLEKQAPSPCNPSGAKMRALYRTEREKLESVLEDYERGRAAGERWRDCE